MFHMVKPPNLTSMPNIIRPPSVDMTNSSSTSDTASDYQSVMSQTVELLRGKDPHIAWDQGPINKASMQAPACDRPDDIPSEWAPRPQLTQTQVHPAGTAGPANAPKPSDRKDAPKELSVRPRQPIPDDSEGNTLPRNESWALRYHDDGAVTAEMPIAVRRFVTSAERASDKAFYELLHQPEKDAVESINGEAFVREAVFVRLQREYQYHVGELVDQLALLKTQVKVLGGPVQVDGDAAGSDARPASKRAAGAVEPGAEPKGCHDRALTTQPSVKDTKDIVLSTVVLSFPDEPRVNCVRGCIRCIRAPTIWFNIGASITFGELRSAWADEAGQVARRFEIWHRTGLVEDLDLVPGKGVFLDAGGDMSLSMRSKVWQA